LKIEIYKTINTIFKKGNKMKKILLLLLAISLICGCKKQETLYIYNWSDYIDPEFIVKFENENNCKVVIDTFDSNETMYAKLKAGASGYDICFPTEYFIPILKNENIIEKIDITKLPNVEKNIDKRFCKNNGLQYYIPYAFSCTGILYRKDKFSNINIKNWNDVFAMKSIARICMFDDIREIIGISLKSNGFSVNSTNQNELLIASKTAYKWKTSVIKMDNEGYKNGVANGEIDFAMGYNSDAIQLMLEMENDIEFIVPPIGTTSSMDTITIFKSSNKKDLSYKFINALYEKEVAVKNSEYICAPMPIQNLSEHLSDEYKKIKYMNITDELLNKCETINDVGDAIELYNKVWDIIKSFK
jgi:spermidine/putrescine transport system substrate-binding protein